MQREGMRPPRQCPPFGGRDGALFYVLTVLCSLAELSDLFPFALENDIK